MLLANEPEIRGLIETALAEDTGSGDATTRALLPPEITVQAAMIAREPLVMAGLSLAEQSFLKLSTEIQIEERAGDGQRMSPGDELMVMTGPGAAVLTAERVALNFVQRLSGIATLTAQFVEAIEGTGAKILDTRKTTPGWRRLEKYAVRCGGGHNHRFGLFDQILIKDNHLAALAQEKPNPIAAAVQKARAMYPELKIEVEADNLEQVEQAVDAGADVILLDNMSLEELQTAVKRIAGRAQTEASGGVNLSNVRSIAETGVDFISVGALTHSARAVDIALEFKEMEVE